jgi:hypothetical protein
MSFSCPPGQAVPSDASLSATYDGFEWSDGAPCCPLCAARFVGDPVSLDAHFQFCFNSRVRTLPSLPIPTEPDEGSGRLFGQHPFDLPAAVANKVLLHLGAAHLGQVSCINRTWRRAAEQVLPFAVFREPAQFIPSSLRECSCLCCPSTTVTHLGRPCLTFVGRSEATRRRDATLQSIDIYLQHKLRECGSYNLCANPGTRLTLIHRSRGASLRSILTTTTVRHLYEVIYQKHYTALEIIEAPWLNRDPLGLWLLVDARTRRPLTHLDAPLAMYFSSAETIWLSWIPPGCCANVDCFTRSLRAQPLDTCAWWNRARTRARGKLPSRQIHGVLADARLAWRDLKPEEFPAEVVDECPWLRRIDPPQP